METKKINSQATRSTKDWEEITNRQLVNIKHLREAVEQYQDITGQAIEVEIRNIYTYLSKETDADYVAEVIVTFPGVEGCEVIDLYQDHTTEGIIGELVKRFNFLKKGE